MSITELIMKMPPWYFWLMVGFSVYYAIRGVMSEFHKYEQYENLGWFFKFIYAYIQEILFKVIFTASAFVALLVANQIFSTLTSIDDIGTGTAIVLICLIIWGVTGISGYLTHLIVSGKFPMAGK